jgi:hypothetical protein
MRYLLFVIRNVVAVQLLVCFLVFGKSFGNEVLEDSGIYNDYLSAEIETSMLNPTEFRCVVVGDSQTTTPDPKRIRTQFHRWDVPFAGEQLSAGASSAGYLVNNISINNLQYTVVNPNTGWNDGGSEDFFAPSAAQWTCSGDVQSPGARFGRYRIGFGDWNVDAPYSTPWGVGVDLVAKIAVRTGLGSVAAVMTRGERGDLSDIPGQQVHLLDQFDGIQIIEQFIPASIDPQAVRVGVGLFLPSGYVEQAGQTLQVLGVSFVVAEHETGTTNGFMAAYQGRGGWNVQDHLNRTSNLSRRALIQMSDASHVMVMLGHNAEPEGISVFESRIIELVAQWELAFTAENRERPTFVFVSPWPLEGASIGPYLVEVNEILARVAKQNPQDKFVSYFNFFDGTPPNLYDPVRYTLDAGQVHPDDIQTAVHLAEDLFEMLFESCVVDMNRDHALNFLDLSAFLQAFQEGNLLADFAEDGNLNFLDVSLFISTFAKGCQ